MSMNYYFLSHWQRDDLAVAFTIGKPPISYELVPSLEGKNRLPFDLFSKNVNIIQGEFVLNDDLTSLNFIWLDFLPNCLAWPMMSERMKEIIRNDLTGLEEVDWVMVNVRLAEEQRPYFIPRFSKELDVLNFQETTYVPNTKHIIKPCFSIEKVEKYSIFYKPISHFSWSMPHSIYINEIVKDSLLKANITGIEFDLVATAK